MLRSFAEPLPFRQSSLQMFKYAPHVPACMTTCMTICRKQTDILSSISCHLHGGKVLPITGPFTTMIYMSHPAGIMLVQVFGALNQNETQLVPAYSPPPNGHRRLSQSFQALVSPALSPQAVRSNSLHYLSAGSPKIYAAELEWSRPSNGTIRVV